MTFLLRFFSLARGQWDWMMIGILLGALVITANTLLMALSGWFIASMAVSGASGAAFNFFFPSAGIRFLAISRTIGRYAERLVTHEATFRILSDLRVWLFTRLAPLAPAALEASAAGDVAGRLRADVDALENIYLRILAPLLSGGITLVAGLLFLAYFSPLSAAIVAVIMVVGLVFLPLIVLRMAAVPGTMATVLGADLRRSVTEGVSGVEELILLGAVGRQVEQVEKLSAGLILRQEQLARIQGVVQAGLVACSGATLAVVLLAGSQQVSLQQLPGPDLVMLLLFSAALFEAAGPFTSACIHLPSARESAYRVFELADTVPPIPDPSTPAALPQRFDLQAHGLTAGYLNGNPVLSDLNFSLPQGSCGVISGPSGSGKSLIAEIMTRFRTYSGSFTVGGTELRDLPGEDLRTVLALLPQRPHLFNGSIRDNILISRPAATGAELESVLYDSCLDGWISTLPQGMDTPVGELGSQVSGGEGRRIALARTLLKPAPLLILDEPTEGLDISTERELVGRLAKRFVRLHSTVLIISHRPACRALGDMVLSLHPS